MCFQVFLHGKGDCYSFAHDLRLDAEQIRVDDNDDRSMRLSELIEVCVFVATAAVVEKICERAIWAKEAGKYFVSVCVCVCVYDLYNVDDFSIDLRMYQCRRSIDHNSGYQICFGRREDKTQHVRY